MKDRYFKQTPEEMESFLDFIGEDIENVRRAVKAIQDNGIEANFVVHPKAETVDESAENMDVDAGQIVKSLVFKSGDEFVTVLCSGDRRVSEDKLENVTGNEVRMARPEEVKEATGYVVGGVSPFDLDIRVFLEKSIMENDKVKPAAGSRVIGVEIKPERLKDITDAKTVDLSG